MNEMTQNKLNAQMLTPKSFDDAIKIAEYLAKSSLVPQVFQGKPHDIVVAIQTGFELGMSVMVSLRSICVINGRPSIWGDAQLGLVMQSGLLVNISEEIHHDKAVCTVERKGGIKHVSVFTMQDAITAGLSKKPGAWQQYPKRMLQLRARGYALRNIFPDILLGLDMAEEIRDEIEINASITTGKANTDKKKSATQRLADMIEDDYIPEKISEKVHHEVHNVIEHEIDTRANIADLTQDETIQGEVEPTEKQNLLSDIDSLINLKPELSATLNDWLQRGKVASASELTEQQLKLVKDKLASKLNEK